MAEEKSSPIKRGLSFIFVLVVIIVIGLGGGAYYVYNNLQPVDRGEPILVTIPKGAASSDIGQILYNHGLIRNALVFKYYIRMKGVDNQLQAGQYQFTPGESMDDLIRKLKNGDIYVETITFTIPEGLKVDEIADLLANKGLVNREKFLELVNTGSFDYEFINNIPKNKNRKYRLEGYLFPETYELEKGATEYDIINRMLAQFEKEFKPEWLEELKKRKITLDEAVTLSSIVEREVKVDKERERVAGLFFNRLEIGMALQSDATVQYALGKQKEIVTYADLEIDSLYNTYKYPGLPPGPISSPGRNSLKAVVYPEKNDFLYFVTKKDGSGEHYFAKTFAEHRKNIAKSKEEQ
ncbi:endolytic transglycosylase MltG [Microaerobacter geothermalis]|uniref:endolytic transglycosylase MltG n=1 Tax=Microaerobacter geothermalis TaxID=674972 RepID=UPI001F3C74BC|nr:endolytic transglycosylase MltG [Microaerobacter geothermalis]MCF6093996.1 endolytic transglycosylase MltG [Microaerobacter geothermalis]